MTNLRDAIAKVLTDEITDDQWWVRDVSDAILALPEMQARERVSLLHDAGGSGRIWQVWIDNMMVWSHAAIEGPVPDALDLWNTLAKYLLPLHRISSQQTEPPTES